MEQIQVKIMMIKEGRGGSVAERELQRLEEWYRNNRRATVSEIQKLERRAAAGEEIADELHTQTEQLKNIELELRSIDDFRIVYKDKIRK